MRSEDHLALGCYLLAQENVPQLRRHCIAFLLGCIEPDYNQFSYCAASFITESSAGIMRKTRSHF